MSSRAMQLIEELSGNATVVRNKALKKLKKFIEMKSSCENVFTLEVLSKLWKGLFYTLWMADKPLVQERVADTIAETLHAFSRKEQQLSFVEEFFNVVGAGWFSIDKFRINKFMMLLRRMIHECFVFLQLNDWDDTCIEELMETIDRAVFCEEVRVVPLGVKLNFLRVFLRELAVVAAGVIDEEKSFLMIKIFFEILVNTDNMDVVRGIREEIFNRIYQSFPYGIPNIDETVQRRDLDPDEEVLYLMFDYDAIVEALKQCLEAEDLPPKNRSVISSIVKQFWRLEEIDPTEELREQQRQYRKKYEVGLTEEEKEEAFRRLCEEENKRRNYLLDDKVKPKNGKRKKSAASIIGFNENKKKRTSVDDDDETGSEFMNGNGIDHDAGSHEDDSDDDNSEADSDRNADLNSEPDSDDEVSDADSNDGDSDDSAPNGIMNYDGLDEGDFSDLFDNDDDFDKPAAVPFRNGVGFTKKNANNGKNNKKNSRLNRSSKASSKKNHQGKSSSKSNQGPGDFISLSSRSPNNSKRSSFSDDKAGKFNKRNTNNASNGRNKSKSPMFKRVAGRVKRNSRSSKR